MENIAGELGEVFQENQGSVTEKADLLAFVILSLFVCSARKSSLVIYTNAYWLTFGPSQTVSLAGPRSHPAVRLAPPVPVLPNCVWNEFKTGLMSPVCQWMCRFGQWDFSCLHGHTLISPNSKLLSSSWSIILYLRCRSWQKKANEYFKVGLSLAALGFATSPLLL